MQERAQATRQRVIEAAASVFDRRGYAAATMSEILKGSGLSKGAVYFHFQSKEQLAQAVLAEDRRYNDTSVVPGDSPVQDVVDISHGFADALQRDVIARASVRLAIEHGTFNHGVDFTTYNIWEESIAVLFEQAKSRGHLRSDVDPKAAAEMLVASFTGLQIVSQVTSKRRDLHHRLTTWWAITLTGLMTPQCRSQINPAGSRAHPTEIKANTRLL